MGLLQRRNYLRINELRYPICRKPVRIGDPCFPRGDLERWQFGGSYRTQKNTELRDLFDVRLLCKSQDFEREIELFIIKI
jgi:hypothetical protein